MSVKTVTLGAVVNVLRVVVASTFVFSGYVKAIDPLGTQYKLHDYLEAWHLIGYVPDFVTLVAAVLLGGAEFCLGVFLLFAVHRRLVSRLLFAMMCVLTPLTLWLAIDHPISDCGCFGDAVPLTNWQTFYKNVALLAATTVLMVAPHKMGRFISLSNQWIVVTYTLLFILLSSGNSLYDLPPFDFRPYRVGTDIKKGMEIPEGAKPPKFETVFVLEKDGEQREFTLEDYPDSTWTFIDSKTVTVEEGYVPPIHDFMMQTLDGGEDVTDSILSRRGYTFLFVSPHLEQADDANFGTIDRIYEYSQEHGYPFVGLTATGEAGIARWRELTGAEYPFYNMDAITLKTIIRSNPGLLLLKDGVVVGKWSHNRLPELDEVAPPLPQTPYGVIRQESVSGKVSQILLLYLLPLLLLSLADRTWKFTRWISNKTFTYSIYKRLKGKKKMRKKIVAGNWKMNMNLQEGVALAKELNETLAGKQPNCDVVICTPFIHLASVAQLLNQDVIGLGAENCADKEKGAYTGEVSAEMVKSTGAQYVILGHSERRGYYGETPEILKEKVLLALKNGLKVIFCIGESLEEREANKQNEVVKAELEGSVFNLTAEEFKNIIIAYEPIWAIGTGKTATSDQAEEIHAYIRSIVAEKYGHDVADATSILYGGSCKASNAPELFAKPDIDGGLIGGASLKAADFLGIVDAWK